MRKIQNSVFYIYNLRHLLSSMFLTRREPLMLAKVSSFAIETRHYMEFAFPRSWPGVALSKASQLKRLSGQ